jgi:hypothetical protein
MTYVISPIHTKVSKAFLLRFAYQNVEGIARVYYTPVSLVLTVAFT